MKKASKQDVKDALDSIYYGDFMEHMDYLDINFVPYDNLNKAIKYYPHLTMRQAVNKVYKNMPMTKGMLLNYHASLGLVEEIHIILLNNNLYMD